MTRLYIVRHCQARANVERRFHGTTDGDITPLGLRQLAALSARFSDIGLDAVYSSPLRRAMATAGAIEGGRGLDITLDNRLIEMNGGDWEGLTVDEWRARYPEQAHAWFEQPDKVALPNGESFWDVYARTSAAIDEIVAANRGGTVAIATHGAVIHTLMSYFYGVGVAGIKEVGWADNTGVQIIDVAEDGTFTVKAFNDLSHLDGVEEETANAQS